MDDSDIDQDRFRQLPEPIRLSQTWITYAAVPAPLIMFGDGCAAPFGGPGAADGD